MRSPQLISPTQAQMVPSGVNQSAPPTIVGPVGTNGPPLQRSISNSLFFFFLVVAILYEVTCQWLSVKSCVRLVLFIYCFSFSVLIVSFE